ncbi:hypothetical protein HELRODRAFT_189374 [Helobdella robusta]|uniref:Uncharacterized protein n=1 Tax=Helobdella robusta TaxID=6412 RepID=T1FR02_HELRO|nr:hypothetical protein HELRODRAFT_189374 [Helobdella robusta]ESN94206.1 hypothetical protein HELRODRAFT_189374 [Helobdella robusta]
MCCSSSSPPSFTVESRVITTAVINESVFSALLYVVKFVLYHLLTKQNSFVLSFCRCHLTITVNLALILVSKLWQAKMSAILAATRRKDGGVSSSGTASGHSTSNNNKPFSLACHETLKNQPSNVSTSKKSQESGDFLMSGLNHEEVKNEFKRIYKQLEAYNKTKPSRKDVAQLTSKKQSTSKKQGHRRFSLHNFHHNRHNKHHNPQIGERTKCLEESVDREQGAIDVMKVTPEESSTSAEGRVAVVATGSGLNGASSGFNSSGPDVRTSFLGGEEIAGGAISSENEEVP